MLSDNVIVGKSLFLLPILFFFFSLNSLYGQTSAQQIPTIELNKMLTGEISGTQKQSYQITLPANQYAKIQVEQKGIDIGVRLYGTDGKILADFDTEMRANGTEIIEFVPQIEGNYRFEIINKYPLLPAGKYELRLVELRSASENEKSQQEARNFHADSLRLFNSGKYRESQEMVEKALDINKRELGTENQTVVLNLTQLARVIDIQGNFDEAIKINNQVLAIEKKIFEPNHLTTANTLNYLATNYNHLENYEKAIDFHQKALTMREKILGENHPIVAVSNLNLGVVYSSLGDLQKANNLYQKALSVWEKTAGIENFNGAVMLNNIGKIYNDTEEYKKAEPYLQRAVGILEKIYKPDNPRIFDALTNLALCYVGLNDLVKAESLYLRILESREKTFGENHLSTAHVLYNLGNLFSLNKNLVKAEPFYRRALQIRESNLGAESPSFSEGLSALSLLLAQKGDVAQSLKIQKQANEIDERNISLNLTIGSERQKLAYLNNLLSRTNQSLLLQTEFAANDPFAAEIAVTTVLRQKGRVLDAVANNLTELRRRSSQEDKELLDKLNKLTQQISELILSGAEDGELTQHLAKIKALTEERETLEDEISRRVAGFYPKSKPVTLQAVQAVIPNDFALLEFAAFSTDKSLVTNSRSSEQKRYIVYLIKNQGEVKWKDLGEIKDIDEAIKAFRQALRDPQNKDTQKLARALDEKVMKPIRLLLGETKKIFVSPDGDLNLIPFEALVDEKNHFLIEDYSFTYLTSGRDLLRMQTARNSRHKLLLIANPAFGGSDLMQSVSAKRKSITVTRNLSDTYFAPLSGTAQEARSIQTFFPDAAFLTGKEASETALKDVDSPRILHIATHGFFLEDSETKKSKIENPLLRSGLALAGANQRKGEKDDGILTAFEASGLNLWGTKLVVLSACETGLGEVKNGEGVYGLRRAFVLAGTESLVMSLWSVSDLVTRELMTNFYKNLKEGKGRSEALRQSQIEMLKKPNRQHPFYWASFIHSGEWANLDGKR